MTEKSNQISPDIINSMPSVIKIKTTSDGKQYWGTGFYISNSGHIATCHHVIYPQGEGISPSNITIEDNGSRYTGRILAKDEGRDIAILKVDKSTTSVNIGSWNSIQPGDDVVFIGYPVGVKVVSLFSGIISAKGTGLIAGLPGEMMQVNGTVNRGNSGGPLYDYKTGHVVGIITAKYIALFNQVEKLQKFVKGMPQVPSGAGMQGIDFGRFVNFIMDSIDLLTGTLILVQVGIGYAIPIDFLPTY